MGIVVTVYAIDDALRQRITEPRPRGGLLRRLRGGPAGDADDLFEEIEEQCEDWSPERGDGKSWDVVHWALMGRGIGSDTELFGAETTDDPDLAEWSGTLDPGAVVALSATLAGVDETLMRRRLAEVPDELYWADTFGAPEEHDDVIADAREFVEFVRGCADRGHGLLITMN